MNGRGNCPHFHAIFSGMLDQHRIFHTDIRKSRHDHTIPLLFHSCHGIFHTLVFFFHPGEGAQHGNHLIFPFDLHSRHLTDVGKIALFRCLHTDRHGSVGKIRRLQLDVTKNLFSHLLICTFYPFLPGKHSRCVPHAVDSIHQSGSRLNHGCL